MFDQIIFNLLAKLLLKTTLQICKKDFDLLENGLRKSSYSLHLMNIFHLLSALIPCL